MDAERYTLINYLSFNYIPDDLKEICYNNLKRDIYYFYHGIKIEGKDIDCINGLKWDLSKDNLFIKN